MGCKADPRCKMCSGLGYIGGHIVDVNSVPIACKCVDRGSTHWDGCWRHRGHQRCAERKVAELEARLREAEGDLLNARTCTGVNPCGKCQACLLNRAEQAEREAVALREAWEREKATNAELRDRKATDPWLWQDDEENDVQALACPVLMSADQARDLVSSAERTDQAERDQYGMRFRLASALGAQRKLEVERDKLAGIALDRAATIRELRALCGEAAAEISHDEYCDAIVRDPPGAPCSCGPGKIAERCYAAAEGGE